METVDCYLDRKHREISLLAECLACPLELPKPTSPEMAIEQKFRLAAAIKAERSLQNWSVTETAWTPDRPAKAGPFEFNYGYQRADLSVHGPRIYRTLRSQSANLVQETIYASSGMSAVAALLTALSKLCDCAEAILPNGCYGETRELFERLGYRLRTLTPKTRTALYGRETGVFRVALLDSSVRSGFFEFEKMAPDDIDLVIFDTTCCWRSSGRIRRVAEWALRSRLPLVFVRSHAKLDCLGIEYGRLGSVVITAPLKDILGGRRKWLTGLTRETNESIRLLGAAPIPANFPPFAAGHAFERCTVQRIAAIIRNNRRMVRLLSDRLGRTRVVPFQHGLYFTLERTGNPSVRDATNLAASLCRELVSSGLPVAHAGSFGFDFVAVEWFADSWSSCNAIRIAAPDLPFPLIDRIAEGIARAWTRYESTSKIHRSAMRTSDTAA
jgi:hypothetical protein